MPIQSTVRRGITLIEVMVVIVLLGMLAGLLTPALGRARERGRVTACTNNQYQIAFGLLRCDDQTGAVPGWLNASPNGARLDNDDPLPCSWAVVLLPSVGRGDLADMWGELPAPAPVIEQFLCPSASSAGAVLDRYPPLHYAGNAGVDGRVAADGVFLNLYPGSGVASVSLADIAEADGASTTLALSEKSGRGDDPHRWDFSVATPPALFGIGQAYPPVFGISGSPPSTPFAVVNREFSGAFAPSSPHPDGVVVAYCDGRTGFLGNALDFWVYGQLLTPRTRWQGTTNTVNSAAMQPWLLRNGAPYLLDKRDLK